MKLRLTGLFTRYFVLAAMLMLFACGESETDAQMVASAKDFQQKGQLADAVIKLKNVLQANRDNGEARYLLADINFSIGNYVAAEKDYKRASTLGWNVEAAKVGEARSQLELRKYKEIIEMPVDSALWSVTTQANIFALKAIAYASLKDDVEASSALALAQKLDANAYGVLKASAQLQLLRGEIDEAELTLKTALELYPDDADFLLLKAHLAAMQGQLDKALATFQLVIDTDSNKKIMTPQVRSAHIGIMKLAVLRKDFSLVERSRKVLLSHNKNDYEAFYYLAVSAFDQNQLEEAETFVKKILEQSSSHAPTLLLAGAIDFSLKRFEQAAYYLNKYLSVDPDSVRAQKLVGRTYLALGQNEDARKAFRAALKNKPGDAELTALMGLSNINSGQLQTGIEDLEKALLLAPDSNALRQELAKAYITKGQTEDAIKQLNEVLLKGDKNNQAQYMKVLAYVRNKDFESAIGTAKGMLDKEPDNPGIYNLVGTVQALSGDLVQARNSFNRALEIKEGYSRAILSLARLDETEGALSSAQKRYLKLLEQEPNDTESMVSLARLALQRGDVEQQIKWLQSAREADKKHLFSRVALVEIALSKGEISEAEALVEELKDVGARNPAVLAVRSRLLMAQKRYIQAESVLNTFIQAQPEEDVGYYLQAQVQLRLGRQADALLNLRDAYKYNPLALRNVLLLARVELASGNTERALVLADEVIALVPDSAVGYAVKGSALNARKDYTAALAAYDMAWKYSQTRDVLLYRFAATRRASDKEGANQLLLDWLEKHPDDALVANELASVYDLDKNVSAALKYYEMALKGLPDNVSILNNLAWLYRNDNKSRALELSEKAYRLNQSSAGIKDTYGWVLLNKDGVVKEDERLAFSLLKQAMLELEAVPEVRYHYAVSLIRTGRAAEGKQMLRELLASGKSFIGRVDAEKMVKD